MLCPRCNTENADSELFCQKCGLILSGATQKATTEKSSDEKAEEKAKEEQNVIEQNNIKEDVQIIEIEEKPEEQVEKEEKPIKKLEAEKVSTEEVKAEKRDKYKKRTSVLANIKHPIIGLVLTVIVYLILYTIEEQITFFAKFTQRGWTPYAASYLFFWSLSILTEKVINLARLRKCHNIDFIPEWAKLNTDEDIDRLKESILSTSTKAKDNIIGPRISKALEQFRASRNPKDISDVLLEESENDFAISESGYSLVRVFLWTIPILGFIGTVIGVSQAVSGFANFLKSAQEIDLIRNALTGVTNGLSVAFDTTLDALILSVIVMIFMSSVEKVEKDRLQEYDTYCRDSILKLISSQPNGKPKDISESVIEALKDFSSKIVEAWITQAKTIPTIMTESLLSAWDKSSDKWFEGIRQIQQENEKHYNNQKEILDKIISERQSMIEESKEIVSRVQKMLEIEQTNVSRILETERETIKDIVNSQHNLVQRYSDSFNRASSKFEQLIDLQNRLEQDLLNKVGSDGFLEVIREVKTTLDALNPALMKFVEKPVDVEVRLVAVPATPGR